MGAPAAVAHHTPLPPHSLPSHVLGYLFISSSWKNCATSSQSTRLRMEGLGEGPDSTPYMTSGSSTSLVITGCSSHPPPSSTSQPKLAALGSQVLLFRKSSKPGRGQWSHCFVSYHSLQLHNSDDANLTLVRFLLGFHKVLPGT